MKPLNLSNLNNNLKSNKISQNFNENVPEISQNNHFESLNDPVVKFNIKFGNIPEEDQEKNKYRLNLEKHYDSEEDEEISDYAI